MVGLAEAAGFYERNPLYAYDPTRGALGFHRCPDANRMFRAPNQVGKTIAGIVEDWWHLTGRHPYRPVNLDHALGYIMIADLDNAYAEFCAKMWAFAPRDQIHPSCRFVPGKGFFYGSRRLIVMRNGRRAEFRSGEGPVTGSSGGTAGWLHLDEPPKQGHFYEITARVLATGGPIWMTFTPVGRPVEYLRRHVEGDPEHGIAPAEPWTQIVPKLSVEDCTTVGAGLQVRTQEQIDAQRAKYRGSPEYKQRVEGDWEGASEGRRLPAFTDAHVVDDEQLPKKIDEVRLSTDHGTTVGAQVAYLLGIAGKRVYLLDEWVGQGNTSSRDDARAMLAMLRRYGLTVHHVAKAFGDVNSAGKNQGGATMNQKLEEAFMEELGLTSPPFPVRAPRKGSVTAQERAINTKLLEREWFVHKRCKAWIKSASYYTGKEEDLKHAMDGARYGVVDLLGVAPRSDRILVG